MVFDNDDRYIDAGGNQNSNETIKYAAHTHTHTHTHVLCIYVRSN